MDGCCSVQAFSGCVTLSLPDCSSFLGQQTWTDHTASFQMQHGTYLPVTFLCRTSPLRENKAFGSLTQYQGLGRNLEGRFLPGSFELWVCRTVRNPFLYLHDNVTSDGRRGWKMAEEAAKNASKSFSGCVDGVVVGFGKCLPAPKNSAE